MSRTRSCLAALAFTAVSALAQQDPPAPVFTNVAVHDPSILRTGSTFYVYGSHLASASSPDLMKWTQLSTNAAAGNILVPNPATTFSEVLTWAQTNTFWAPDVIRLNDGRYYLYYCACKGDSPLSALGLAVGDTPTGPFSHVAVLLKSGMTGASEDGSAYNATVHPNVVDPAVFFDRTGKLWISYGSYSGGIFILELDPASGRPLAGQGYGKKLTGGNHARIEGPYILYSPETDFYYLFLSFGGLDATGGYNIRVGRSRQPDGPYFDAIGTDLTNVKGAPGTLFDDASIAPHGVKLMGGYQFLPVVGEPSTTTRGYISPGHNSAYRDPATGQYFLVFHSRFVGRGEQHEVRVHQMFFNNQGWPVVAPHRYAGETIAPIAAAQVPGDYKLINHGKAITATVSNSTLITLHADGTISGTVTGTWQLSTGPNVSLTLSGVIYRGVFVRQWDDDNLTWVHAFTALSDNGTAWWGSKVVSPAVGPAVGSRLVNETVTIGHSVAFFATDARGSIRWQSSTNNGATWNDLTDTTPYSGTTTTTLAISSSTSAMNGTRYRFTATDNGATSVSPAVTLTVAPALLPFPTSLAVDGAGNLFVGDANTNTVQKISSTGNITLLAGSSGTSGAADGSGSDARFNQPNGLTLGLNGTVIVTDTANATIRSITASGLVTTLAGSPGIRGNADGGGSTATFSSPIGIARDASGVIYVADAMNHTIRKVTPTGVVSTLAGTAGAGGYADGTGAAARFNYPSGLAVDSAGTLYVADTTNNLIRKITGTGIVTTLAGVQNVAGHEDGSGSGALFNQPSGLTLDGAGNLYVADTGNSTVRRITPAGVVTTIAGLPTVAGLASGNSQYALFNQPRAVAVDASGNLYIADTGNASLRMIKASGTVSTLALTAVAPPAPTPPPAVTPIPSSNGGGGGGGAPSWQFFASLGMLIFVRCLVASGLRPAPIDNSNLPRK